VNVTCSEHYIRLILVNRVETRLTLSCPPGKRPMANFSGERHSTRDLLLAMSTLAGG
jgi:hypothetical protein